MSIYYVVSPDLGAGDSAANRIREGPFSNRIYRLTVIDDKGDLGLGLAPEGWRPELVYPNCRTRRRGAQKSFSSLLPSADLPSIAGPIPPQSP